jgi:hypothetical protein
MFSAVLLLRYAIMLGGFEGLGHPFGGGPDAISLEFKPPEQVVSDDKPDVTKMRRGEVEARRRGMKM